MSRKRMALIGSYPTRTAAEEGLDFLRLCGFRSEDVSAVLPRRIEVSGVFTWLLGTRKVVCTEAGELMAAGPIAKKWVKGGLAETLLSLGAFEAEAKLYERLLKEDSGLVMVVHCGDNDWLERARDIYQRSGATDVTLLARPMVRTSASGSA